MSSEILDNNGFRTANVTCSCGEQVEFQLLKAGEPGQIKRHECAQHFAVTSADATMIPPPGMEGMDALQWHVERLKVLHGTLPLELGPAVIVALVAQLQLALGHPANRGPMAVLAMGFLDRIYAEFDLASPGMGELLKKGDPRAPKPKIIVPGFQVPDDLKPGR